MQKNTLNLMTLLCLGLSAHSAIAADAVPADEPKVVPATIRPTTVPASSILTAMPNPLPQKVNDLIVIDRKVGTGTLAVEVVGNKTISAIDYTAWVYDPKAPDGHGVKFASTLDTKRPYFLLLGEGKVIRGLETGISGMRVGGQRTLIIPSRLGYGGETVAGGKVPGNSDLIFDVTLLAVK
jgi:FKBP-type peptidyl-prolyl cis-trans isomerase FkpA